MSSERIVGVVSWAHENLRLLRRESGFDIFCQNLINRISGVVVDQKKVSLATELI